MAEKTLTELAREVNYQPTRYEAHLEARLAEAGRDAARYRWLRERINWRDVDESGGAFSRDPLKYRARHWTHSDGRLPSLRPADEHIDEYIDAQLTAVSASGGE